MKKSQPDTPRQRQLLSFSQGSSSVYSLDALANTTHSDSIPFCSIPHLTGRARNLEHQLALIVAEPDAVGDLPAQRLDFGRFDGLPPWCGLKRASVRPSLVLGLGNVRLFVDVLRGLGGRRGIVGVAGALVCVAGGVVRGLVDAL